VGLYGHHYSWHNPVRVRTCTSLPVGNLQLSICTMNRQHNTCAAQEKPQQSQENQSNALSQAAVWSSRRVQTCQEKHGVMLMRQDFTSSPFLRQFMHWTVLSIPTSLRNIFHNGQSPCIPFPTFCKACVGVLTVVPTLAVPVLSTITNSRSVALHNPISSSRFFLCPSVCTLLVWSIWYPYFLHFALGLGRYVSDIGRVSHRLAHRVRLGSKFWDPSDPS